mmetsp:Transcript_45275/g.117283  ORF Transcript_45275/g.117283 Transcript_45275/m.117283 type:complete len:230 (-) Transcript_45275:265-954(-)
MSEICFSTRLCMNSCTRVLLSRSYAARVSRMLSALSCSAPGTPASPPPAGCCPPSEAEAVEAPPPPPLSPSPASAAAADVDAPPAAAAAAAVAVASGAAAAPPSSLLTDAPGLLPWGGAGGLLPLAAGSVLGGSAAAWAPASESTSCSPSRTWPRSMLLRVDPGCEAAEEEAGLRAIPSAAAGAGGSDPPRGGSCGDPGADGPAASSASGMVCSGCADGRTRGSCASSA